MIFRAFWGEPCPEARELEHGHLHHAEAPFNPANGEIEDTDVGFPGPEHHIAERALPMKVAMGALAVLAIVGGVAADPVGRPTCSTSSSSRRSPTPTLHLEPERRAHRVSAWCSAPCSALAGIFIAYRIWVLQPGHAARASASASRALHRLFVNKWYFDELIDLARRAARSRGSGASASRPSSAWSSTALFVGGTTGIVRPARPPCARAADRASCAPTPRCSCSASSRVGLLLPASSMTHAPLDPHLASRSPLVLAAARRCRAARGALRRRSLGRAGRRSSRRRAAVPTSTAASGGLQFVTDETWISRAGHPLQARRRRAEPVPDRADGAAVLRQRSLWAALREWERPRLFYLWFGLAESGVLGALMAQDLALFVLFFDLMLVPFLLPGRRLGRAPNRVAAIDQALHLHARRLAADARGGDRDRRAARPGDDHHLRPRPARLAARRLPTGTQDWIFLFFAAAFLVKMPAFPLHGWMPDGYKAMPLPVLAVFSGVLSKVAAYGFLRDRAAAVPRRQRALPGAHAADRAGLDPLRLGAGVHARPTRG